MKADPYHLALSFNQILDLVKQLPASEKQRLITALHKAMKPNDSEAEKSASGKYQDTVQPSDDLDAPSGIFKEYME